MARPACQVRPVFLGGRLFAERAFAQPVGGTESAPHASMSETHPEPRTTDTDIVSDQDLADEQTVDLPPRTAMTILDQSPINSVVVSNLLQDHAQTVATAEQSAPIEQTQPVQ